MVSNVIIKEYKFVIRVFFCLWDLKYYNIQYVERKGLKNLDIFLMLLIGEKKKNIKKGG